jgi:pentatricopeptide repeat protein
MKKILKSFVPILFPAMVFISGCHNHQSGDKNDVLKIAPFAALTDSIAQFSKDAALYLKRAELLTQNNLHELASDDFKKSWELEPTEKTALQYASNLSITNRAIEDEKLLTDCISKYPANGEFKRLLSDLYVQAGRPSKAIALFDEMIKNDSTDADAWYEKGRLLEQSHDTLNAILALNHAFALQPTTTYTLELANIYAESKNARSLTLCDELIGRDSAHELTDPFFIKGIYYSNSKQYDDAIIQFDSCIGRDWKSTDAYIEKGIAFFKQRNYDNAMNTFRTAASVSFNSPDAYFWIGRCYEAINKKPEAAEYYQKAILLDKDFTEAREALKRVS